MLLHSKLPHSFWGEAVATANYVRNRCITRSLDQGTPFEKWHGKKPDIRHLQTFGCKVYVLDKAPGKGKFDSKSVEGIFMGYSDTSKTFRVWVPSQRKICVTRDIKFMDGKGTQPTTAPEVEIEHSQEHNDDVSTQETPILGAGVHMDGEQPADNREEPGGSESDAEGETGGRGPGRPCIIRTCKKGRPRKQYHPARTTPLEIPRDSDQAVESDDENALIATPEIPISQALSGPDGDLWRDAIYEEMRCIIHNDIWDIVDRPIDAKVIGCRTVLRSKLRADGTLKRRKARLVAKGFAQRPGIDFHETFAPVARLSSLRTLIALAAESNMEILQLDITTAYLNGEIDVDIYMETPELLEEMLHRITHDESDPVLISKATNMLRQLKEGRVCKLKKSLYGLRQSGRLWNSKINTALRDIGFIPTNADPCVYVDDEKCTFVMVYVDDILVMSKDKEKAEHTKCELKRRFVLQDLGEAKFCLGIEIQRTREGYFLSQKGYIHSTLGKFAMTECKATKTPLALGLKLTNESSDDERSNQPFREMIGMLMYLAVGTRPDIAHAVNHLSQFCNNHSNVIGLQENAS